MFSKIDLFETYLQVKVDEECSKLLAFQAKSSSLWIKGCTHLVSISSGHYVSWTRIYHSASK